MRFASGFVRVVLSPRAVTGKPQDEGAVLFLIVSFSPEFGPSLRWATNSRNSRDCFAQLNDFEDEYQSDGILTQRSDDLRRLVVFTTMY
jgi:hypothetical protein